MNLINFEINRIIIHQVYQRNADGTTVSPEQSHEYTQFDASAMDEFKARVIDALGSGSSAVQMQIFNQAPHSLPSVVDKMVSQDAQNFAASSFDIATKLTAAQQRKNIPGGIVVVFSGTHSTPPRKILGIIKAEIHSAYQKKVNAKTKEISLEFVKEVLLTPGTRLYKTAAFYEKPLHENISTDLNDKWHVVVSDYQISKSDGKAAAEYFYADFLGFGYPETSARTTKKFYDATLDFISELDVTEEKKSDYLNALTTYLKVETSSVVSGTDFATRYFDTDTKDSYTSFLATKGLPSAAFTKDLEHISSKLKLRKINFSSNIKITGSSEAFKNLVTIETIPGEIDSISGDPKKWTLLTIKDKITGQE